MNIDIDSVKIQLDGDFSPGRAQAIGERFGEALQVMVRARASELAAAPAGYCVPYVVLPTLSVRAGASEEEIAQAVASTLSWSILRGLEVG